MPWSFGIHLPENTKLYFTGQLISQNYCVTLTTSFNNSESFLRHLKVFKKTYHIGKNIFPKRATTILHKPFTLNCWCSHVSCWGVAFQVSSTIQAKETQCATQRKLVLKFVKISALCGSKAKNVLDLDFVEETISMFLNFLFFSFFLLFHTLGFLCLNCRGDLESNSSRDYTNDTNSFL